MRRFAITVLCVLVAVFPVAPVLAELVGENVIEGEADITRDGKTTTIETFTEQTSIDWTGGYDILHDEIVVVEQPTEDSELFNYDQTGDPSLLAGQLTSNATVYIINPSGVFVGNSAIIDVGGLVAAAGDLSPQDFQDGERHFTNLSGDVAVAPGALVSGRDGVALLGRRVMNFGTVVSERGLVAFVAGENAVLGPIDGHVVVRVDGGGDPAGEEAGFALVQGGTVDAGEGHVVLSAGDTYSLAMNHTGVTRGRDIRLEAQGDGLVQVAGTLDASDTRSGATGGDVKVLAGRIALLDARIDASGDAGGGEILVGGDLRGEGDVPTARRTYVGSETELVADALRSGDGGKIIVWSDEKTGFYGSASARGGAASGDGGFIEISGRQSLDARGHSVELSAANGESGTLLYDPLKIEIRGGTADGSDDVDDDPENLPEDQLNDGTLGEILAGEMDDEPFVIYESEIEGTDADIILQAEQNIATSGTFGDNDVVIVAGNSLLIQTTGDPDPDPDAPFSPDFAIDLDENVTWRVSEGGLIAITTGDPGATDPEAASIRVGNLEFGGRSFTVADDGTAGPDLVTDPDLDGFGLVLDEDLAVIVQTNVGDIVVGSITANGDDAADGGRQVASNGAGIALFTQTGDITVNGSVQANGGSARSSSEGEEIPSLGGNGGQFIAQAGNGRVTLLGDIEVSGGQTVVGFIELDDGTRLFPNTQVSASRGGLIDVDATSDGSDPDAGVIVVSGDLVAVGGRGEGVIGVESGDDTIVLEGDGGTGGAIELSGVAGVEIVGAGPDALRIDASGGDGVGRGGNVLGTGAATSINIRSIATEDFTGDGSGVRLDNVAIVANGGNAIQSGAGVVTGDPAAGGDGGGIVITAGTEALDAAGATITANGGNAQSAAGGSSQGVISLSGSEGVTIGDIQAIGGTGQDGVGGGGGDIDITATEGDVEVANIDVSGGDSEVTGDDRDALAGGQGGVVNIDAGTFVSIGEDSGTELETVRISGAIQGFGGTQVRDDGTGTLVPIDDAELAAGAFVDIDADGAIEAGTGGGSIEARLIVLESPSIGAIDLGGTDADGDSATLTSTGSITSNLLADGRLEELTVVHADIAATSALTSGGATPLLTVAAADEGAGTPQTITLMQTDDTGPVLNFVLDAATETTVVLPDLQVDEGAGDLGANGGSIRNDDGAIVGETGGSAAHITSKGDLVIDAPSIGSAVAPLRIDGNDGLAEPEVSLGLSALGTVIVDASSFGAIELSQASAAGGALITHDGSQIAIQGDAGVDPEQQLTGATSDGLDFTYRLTAPAQGGEEAPALEIQDLRLGGDGLFDVTGGITLVNPASGDAAINLAAEGATLGFESGGDVLWTEGGEIAIQTAGTAADPSRLAFDAGGSVEGSSGGALVTEGVDGGALEVAAFFTEDFRLEHRADDGAEVVITQVEVGATPLSEGGSGRTFTGISGSTGDVEIFANGTDSRIVLGAIPLFNSSSQAQHIVTGGDVALRSDVVVENAQYVEDTLLVDGEQVTELVAVNTSRIAAGGDIVFDGAVDTGDDIKAMDETPGVPAPDVDVIASLTLDAGGAVRFRGDVGGQSALARLDTTAAVLEGSDATRTFHADEAIFRGGIDGPLAAEIRGEGDTAASRVAFGGNVGTNTALEGLAVRAESIDFTVADGATVASAERVVTGDGGISLDTETASTPQVATIADTAGNLSFETSGAFTVGENDKLSAVGALGIRAASVTVGDLSAGSIDVSSPDINVRTREGAPVELADGSTVVDGGVDWVANAIRTSSTPVPTGDEGVTLYLGDGGISIPGDLSGFDVRRVDSALSSVSVGSFAGQDGAVLDLTGNGPPLVGDPTRQLARKARLDLHTGVPSFGKDAPGGRAQIGAREALAFLRCSGVYAQATGGTGCAASDEAALAAFPRFEESALATARARDITTRYRDLVGAPGAGERLRAAFATAGRGFAAQQEWQDGTLDGESFYRYLEGAPYLQRDALASVRELAWLFTQIELLGMADADTRRLQQTLAQEFADAAGLEGLSAEAVTAAVEASPVGLVQ